MRKNIKLFLNYFLGPVLFIVLCWSLYRQIIHQPDLPQRWAQIRQSWKQPAFWMVLLLMPVNWGLEALKWKLLLRPLERLSWLTSFKSVLAGCSVTMLTPNRIGEYGGRIVYIHEDHRISAIPLTILGSMGQLFITFIIGTAGLLWLRFSAGGSIFRSMPVYAGNILLVCSLIVSLLLILIYLRVGVIVRLLLRISLVRKANKYIELLKNFTRKQLLRILLLSFLRYLVFILQYILLLKLMQVEIPGVLCFWVLSVFYLVMALAPTIGFTELPIRAAASVELLQMYSSNVLGIQAASLGIWGINLVIPAIAGSLLIFGIKIMKEK